MTPGVTKFQHLVSACLLRRWEVDGKLIAIRLSDGLAFPTRAEKVGGMNWFVGPEDSVSTEGIWAKIESEAGLAFTEVDASADVSARSRKALLKLVVLHTLRSFMSVDFWDANLSKRMAERAARIREYFKPWFLRGFFRDRFGISPVGKEALQIACAMVKDEFESMRSGQKHFAAALPDSLANGLSLMQARPLAIAHIMAPDWIISDAPVMPVNTTQKGVGFGAGVGIASADRVLMPVGPCHTVDVGVSGPMYVAGERAIELQNLVQVLSAHRLIFVSPKCTRREQIQQMVAARMAADRARNVTSGK